MLGLSHLDQGGDSLNSVQSAVMRFGHVETGQPNGTKVIEAVKRECMLATSGHGRLGTDVAPSRGLFEICYDRLSLPPIAFPP